MENIMYRITAKEAAEKFAREQETVYFCELWNKLEIIITDKLPELIYKLHPTIPKEKFSKLNISPKYLRITLDLAKIANFDIKLSHLIEKIYTDVTCLITGHITSKHELTLYVLFDQRLTQKQLDSIINKWKMKTKNNIIITSNTT